MDIPTVSNLVNYLLESVHEAIVSIRATTMLYTKDLERDAFDDDEGRDISSKMYKCGRKRHREELHHNIISSITRSSASTSLLDSYII